MQLDNETLIVVQDLMQLHKTSLNERVQDSLMRAVGRLLGIEFDPQVNYAYSGIEFDAAEARYYMYASAEDSENNAPAVVYVVDTTTGAYTKTGGSA